MAEGIFLAVLLVVIGTFAWGALRGAPWVPTKHGDAKRAVALAQPKPGDHVVDLGCGSGEVLAAFAVQGCRVEGWELAVLPWLVSWWRLRKHRDANIHFGDFWNVRIDADIVYIFLMPKTLERLAKKLRDELRPGTRVISYAFPIPGLTPATVDKVPERPTLYLYQYDPVVKLRVAPKARASTVSTQ